MIYLCMKFFLDEFNLDKDLSCKEGQYQICCGFKRFHCKYLQFHGKQSDICKTKYSLLTCLYTRTFITFMHLFLTSP